MVAITFDTLKYVKELEAAGVPRQQAEAQVRVQTEMVSDLMDDQLATKRDIYEVKEEIKRLEVRIESVKSEIIKWMVALLMGQSALVLTFLKYFAAH